MTPELLVRSIRLWLTLFVAGLVLSGLSAFPLQAELEVLTRLSAGLHLSEHAPALSAWLLQVRNGETATNQTYPFLAYGTDWLAFAHLVIAVAFIGPWRDPVRNRWVITFGIIACLGVLPLALIAGPIRGIPVFWRLIDCCFGVFALMPLWIVHLRIRALERLQTASDTGLIQPSAQHSSGPVFIPLTSGSSASPQQKEQEPT